MGGSATKSYGVESYEGLIREEIESVAKDTGFTEAQIIHLHKRFKYFDKDGDNRLSREDFLLNASLTINPLSDCIIHAFFTDKDKGTKGQKDKDDKDGLDGAYEEKIEFSQFARILARFLPADAQPSSKCLNSREEKLKFAFRIYDKDRDDHISREEMLGVINMLIGHDRSKEQLELIADRTLAEADTDHDGKISFPEFMEIMAKVDIEKKMTLTFKG